MHIQFAMNLDNVNLVPIVSTLKLLENGSLLLFAYHIFGNILWFMPMGILLCVTFFELKRDTDTADRGTGIH